MKVDELASDSRSTAGSGSGVLLAAKNLTVAFASDEGYANVVRGVSLAVRAGESVGLVGESGSGKSVTCKALMGSIAPGGRVVDGDVEWEGRSLLKDRRRASLRAVRGRKLVSIPQDPMTALDPVFTVGYQIEEVCRLVHGASRREARARATELLERVGVPAPARRLKQYPHEFSGGMQQRVLIAMALAAQPQLLVADEPTTALDVTVQKQILELLRELKESLGLALLLVTHDLGVVAEVCDRVMVMYAGRIVESGSCDDIFNRPAHPYTRGLLASSPRTDLPQRERLDGIPGMPPSPYHRPEGCAFAPRCTEAHEGCAREPALVRLGPTQAAACWNVESSER
jgi:oligopeptide/dipeptide ABC transporter ATP-binding protein